MELFSFYYLFYLWYTVISLSRYKNWLQDCLEWFCNKKKYSAETVVPNNPIASPLTLTPNSNPLALIPAVNWT